MQKGAILWKCVNTFVAHCSLINPRAAFAFRVTLSNGSRIR